VKTTANVMINFSKQFAKHSSSA